MRYILKEQYALRGYEDGTAPVVYDLKTHRKYPVSAGMMAALKMCDGKTDFDVLAAMPLFKQYAEYAEKKGMVLADTSGKTLLPEQHYQVLHMPDMRDFHWSITGKCNAKCRHCFINASQRQHRDLMTDEMLDIIEKISAHSISTVCLTGGEPLCRQDLPILLEAMHNHNIHVTRVSTNGFLLTDSMLDLFEKYGTLPMFQISFDGVGCHDRMRGICGAEEMTVKAMDVCKKRGAPVSLAMCLHAGNIASMHDTVRLAVAKDIKLLRVSLTEEFGDFSQKNGIDLLTIDQAGEAYLKYLPVFCRERPDITLELLRFVRINGNEPEKYKILPEEHSCTDFESNRFCNAVRHSFYISSEGRILPCIMTAGTEIEQEYLKLTEHNLEECIQCPAYDMFLHSDASRLLRENPECGQCEHLTKCRCGCRGDSIACHHGVYGTDQKLCDFFKQGWGQRIRQVIDECLNTHE